MWSLHVLTQSAHGFPAGTCLKQHNTKSSTEDLYCCAPAKLFYSEGVPSQPGECLVSLPFCPLVWGRKIHIWIANCCDCRQKGNACNSTLLKIRLLLQHRWAPPWIYRYVAQLHIFPNRGQPETLNSDGIDEPGGQDWNILADRPSVNWGMDRKDCQVNKEDVSRLFCPPVICVGAQLQKKIIITLQTVA